MLLNYIDSIDDEIFLTQIVLEQDYQGRDALRTAVEHDLLDLIQAPKIEGIIKRIYNSDYEQYGNIYEMSTSYQILYGDKTLITDIESQHRFYKQRDLKDVPQSKWAFEILKESMSTKIQMFAVIGILYVIISTSYYEVVINIVL